MKTTWTEKRLQALFNRYNRKYWRGRLPRYRIINQDMRKEDCRGHCGFRKRQILLDVSQHESDLAVRATLLHEMCHAAAPRRPYHGYPFWSQFERLLRYGAPVRVRQADAREFTKTILRASVKRLPLCHAALELLLPLRIRRYRFPWQAR